MALRLTKTTLPTVAGTDTGDANAVHAREAALVQELVRRSAVDLSHGDSNGYLQRFAEARTIENPQRAYQACKLLLEQGLSSLPSVDDRRATAILLAMARGVLATLDAQPSEPVLLNYAGVVMYELWALEAARALFQAAKRLDPELPHLGRNLVEVERRAGGDRAGKLALHPLVSDLNRRSRRVASRAKPASGMRLSVCMIVRDEEEMLPRTLAAIAPAADEIIVVDTGSTDQTIAIARSFGATVIQRAWTGSFSEARNASLEAATGDWFLYLDADEVLVAADVEQLKALTGQVWREAFYLQETNFTGTEESGAAIVHSALRLIRNRPHYRFSGRLHEQIAFHLPAYLPERLAHSTVRVNHYGYLGVVRESKDKARRNLELLLAQRRETPERDLGGFFHYNLGSEYFAAGDVASAVAELETAMQKVERADTFWHEYVPSLLLRSVKALRAAGRNEEALARAEAGLQRFPDFTDLVFEQGMANLALDQLELATAFLERAMAMGDAPSRYTATVGAGTFMPRIVLATLHLNHRRWERAIELLTWCAEQHPENVGNVYPLATALLQSGRDPDLVVAQLERLDVGTTAAARFMLATALYEQGHAVAAEQQFRKVLAKHAQSWAARAALVESLLYQRRYTDAAQEAALVADDAPAAAVVARSGTFACILADDLHGAQVTLERARRVGVSDGDCAALAAWLDLKSGRTPNPLPAQALSLTALMLEATLRVHDFANFESLLGLLAHLPIAERERRELLAQMYLRRGFLRSAGREWLVVCEREPDAAGLVGLALVALADGRAETATTFASHALKLEPDNATARKLLERTAGAALTTAAAA